MNNIKSDNINELMIILLIFCVIVLVIWLKKLTKHVSILEKELKKQETIIRKQSQLNILISNELKKGKGETKCQK